MGLENKRIVDPILTSLARGYQNAAMIAELLFPTVRVKKEAGTIPLFGKEAFKQYDTKRAIRAASNRMSPEARSTTDYVMDEHDMEYPIDYREGEEDVFNLRDYARMVTQDIVLLDREIEAATLATTPANFPTGNKVALSSTDCFDDYDNSTPIEVVDTAKEGVRAKIGREANVGFMGASTFSILRNHPKLIERIKYSQRGVVTLDLMKEIFGLEELHVGKAIKAADDGTVSDVWGDMFLVTYMPRYEGKPNHYRPYFGYSMAKEMGLVVDSYTGSGGKLEFIRTTDRWAQKIVGAESGYLITNTKA